MESEYILVTGSAGFIGAALSKYLINKGFKVIGMDNINNYYDIELKKARLKNIETVSLSKKNWLFESFSIENNSKLNDLFIKYKPKKVVHLAAQAGVRNSLINPSEYIQSNIVGFGNILETSRKNNVKHFVYASSSSVYGANENLPYREDHKVDHPVSLYASTKRSNELMAHTYSHLYNLPTTGLRFFTVYGPWGRPDMAPMIFAESIINNRPIPIFNNGKMIRDFTYIDDIVESIYRCINKPPINNPNFCKENTNPDSSYAPFRVFNIGNGVPIKLLDFIEILENSLGIKAIREFKPMQLGDVESTAACTIKLQNWIDYKPKTDINKGIREFVEWYREYYS